MTPKSGENRARPHVLRVALGEVVVDCHEVRATAGECVEIQRQCSDQRLTFTGLHFGDLALVEHDAAQQLHIEVSPACVAPRRLAHYRKRFRQQVVE